MFVSREVQRGKFVAEGVGDEGGDDVGEVMGNPAVAGMLDLADVFELVDDGFDEGAFAQQELIHQGHETVLHVAFEACDQLQAAGEKTLEERLGDISPVAEEFAPEFPGQGVNGLPVVDVARREADVEELPAIIDDQVEFEAEEPAGGTLALAAPGRP